MSRYDRNERLGLRIGFAAFAVATAVMLGFAYHDFATLPAAYETLRERGVPAVAHVRCGDDVCTLTYAFRGRTHRNEYRTQPKQFAGARSAPVLVDPRHPSTMYTVRDVARNTNAGFGPAGVIALLLAAAFGAGTFFCGRALRDFVPLTDQRPEIPAGLPESRRLALEAIDATQDLLLGGTLAARSGTARYDPEELVASVGYLRERLAALPAEEQLARGLGEEIARELDEARPQPLLGGVRLNMWRLHHRLGQLRIRVLHAAR